MVKNILKLLKAYEKYIVAGVAFQSLCNEDDFKNYLYTKQDYIENKPVNELLLACINTPELFRKETEKFIKEVVKASKLKQNNPELLSKFRDFKNSWLELLREVKNIPSTSRRELITALKGLGKEDAERYAMAEDLTLREWVDVNGNKTNVKVPTAPTNSSNNKSATDDFTAVFRKLCNHIDSIWGDMHTIACTKHELDIYYGDGANRQNLIIKFVPAKNYFEIELINSYNDSQLFKGKRSDWGSVLSSLKILGAIKDKSLCEWVDASGNKISSNKPASQSTVGKSDEFVYIWDMYIDPIDKGTWCSAEKYNGEYDGFVFKTKEEAFRYGKEHLYELEDEGELRGDPDDYDIDTVTIRKSEVSDYTLKFSGI